jgi:multimeric flavodoxin WrbA
MRVLGIVGSPRSQGNTERAVSEVLRAISEQGIRTELVTLGPLEIKPCDACVACRDQERCIIEDDFQGVYDKMVTADGIVVGSPVYFSGPNAKVLALLQRAGYVSQMSGRPFERKVGGAIAVARRAGHNAALSQMLFFFLHQGMIVPGATYWNVAFGRDPGEIERDEEGMKTLASFGSNVAWILKKLRAAE